MKTKVVQKWYQSTGIALVLGHLTSFFNLKRAPSWILKKKVFLRCQLSPDYWSCETELVKHCNWCIALISLELHSISSNRSDAV